VPDLTVKGGGSVKASLVRFGHKVWEYVYSQER
jgi:hypothetical protein